MQGQKKKLAYTHTPNQLSMTRTQIRNKTVKHEKVGRQKTTNGFFGLGKTAETIGATKDDKSRQI